MIRREESKFNRNTLERRSGHERSPFSHPLRFALGDVNLFNRHAGGFPTGGAASSLRAGNDFKLSFDSTGHIRTLSALEREQRLRV